MSDAKQGPKGLVYRGCEISLQAVESPDDPGRFIVAWMVIEGETLKYQGKTLESYATAHAALTAGERSIPLDLDRLLKDRHGRHGDE